VNLLSSALPGIRDLRAPLVAGYLWLLLAYLIVEPGADFENLHGTAAQIVDLAHTIGPVGTAVAVSVAAFFVGALSQPVANALAKMLRDPLSSIGGTARPRRRRRLTVGARSAASERREVSSAMFAFTHDGNFSNRVDAELARYPITVAAAAMRVARRIADGRKDDAPELGEMLRAWRRVDEGLLRAVWSESELGTRRVEETIVRGEDLYEDFIDDDRRDYLWCELVGRTRELATQAEEQLEIPATLLVGDQALPFAEADRERAEAELRVGTSLPLAALAGLLMEAVSTWWGLLLLVAVALLWQGLLREDSARRLIIETIVHKDVPFTPFGKFTAAVEATEREAASTAALISAAPSE
jgi:hypothetical protein